MVVEIGLWGTVWFIVPATIVRCCFWFNGHDFLARDWGSFSAYLAAVTVGGFGFLISVLCWGE